MAPAMLRREAFHGDGSEACFARPLLGECPFWVGTRVVRACAPCGVSGLLRCIFDLPSFGQLQSSPHGPEPPFASRTRGAGFKKIFQPDSRSVKARGLRHFSPACLQRDPEGVYATFVCWRRFPDNIVAVDANAAGKNCSRDLYETQADLEFKACGRPGSPLWPAHCSY